MAHDLSLIGGTSEGGVHATGTGGLAEALERLIQDQYDPEFRWILEVPRVCWPVSGPETGQLPELWVLCYGEIGGTFAVPLELLPRQLQGQLKANWLSWQR
ncbi:MAG TPA: hypothetical protein VI322_04670 [Candidatus Saccharimonadia bacterium]